VTFGRKLVFDTEIEFWGCPPFRDRAVTVNGEDLPAMLGTRPENPLEDALLGEGAHIATAARLIDNLDAFGAEALIGPRIALKRGTAPNVFHSVLDRLSVDIDVNYVGAIEK
jgi:hypothetical protein